MIENSCILEYVHKYINHVSSNLVKGIHCAIAFEEEALYIQMQTVYEYH